VRSLKPCFLSCRFYSSTFIATKCWGAAKSPDLMPNLPFHLVALNLSDLCHRSSLSVPLNTSGSFLHFTLRRVASSRRVPPMVMKCHDRDERGSRTMSVGSAVPRGSLRRVGGNRAQISMYNIMCFHENQPKLCLMHGFDWMPIQKVPSPPTPPRGPC